MKNKQAVTGCIKDKDVKWVHLIITDNKINDKLIVKY